MKSPLFYIAFLLTLLSCGSHPGQIEIQGRFAHLEQGEFFLYVSEGENTGRIDTLRIRDGEFLYTAPQEGSAIMHVLYPNYSQLTLFVQGGENIEIEGDAQNLSAVKVKGNKDNELYTKYRHAVQGKSLAEKRIAAKEYIQKNPTLVSSRYMFAQEFLLSDSTNRQEVEELFDSICRACPDDVEVSRMTRMVRAHRLFAEGEKMPDFQLDSALCHYPLPKKNTKKNTVKTDTAQVSDSLVSLSDYQGKYMLMIFWAGWKNGSRSAIFQARKLRKEMKLKEKELQIVGYSLDTDAGYLRDVEKRDSVDFCNYCDYKAFSSPLVQKWNIRDLPFIVLVSPESEIIASGTDWKKDIEPKARALCL